jgi:hypothetical protein
MKTTNQQPGPLAAPAALDRRLFLRYAGLGLTITSGALLLQSCNKDDDNTTPTTASVDLGSGDIGILNYAYALEQLEAAFYTQVINTPYTGITDAERTLLTEIRDHEIIHREFFKAALGTNAIAGLEVNFAAINFADRASVLNTAKTFEDLGISAYNGAGKLIKDVNYLLLAGKIVSVEARHAAAIRSLLMPKTASFAGDDVVNVTSGLDGASTPTMVLPLVQPFVKTTITGNNLPK